MFEIITFCMSELKIDKRSTINISSHLYEELQKEAEEKHFTIKDHVEVILDRHLKRNQMISRIWPGLQIAGVDDNAIVLVNILERKFYDVKLRQKSLHCMQDKSTGCDHTAFVWMQAEDLELDGKL
jgi:hypothetical protein